MDEIVRVQILPTGILPLLVADCLESPKEVERGMSASIQFTSEQAKEVGDKLGIDWSRFDVEQFRMGMNVELEHGVRDPSTNVTGNDPTLTGKIALAHQGFAGQLEENTLVCGFGSAWLGHWMGPYLAVEAT